jgi:hypothetical protein
MAAAKKAENALEDVALVAGTQQNLSNLLFFRYLWVSPWWLYLIVYGADV